MTNTLFNYFIAGTFGVLFQIFVLKYPKLKQSATIANHPFTFGEYLKNDWYAILGSFISVGIMILCLDEWLPLNPVFEKYVKWLFVFVGFTGSSVIQAVLSLTSKKINAVIDVKTNIADGITPPVTEENKIAVPEIQKEENK